MRSETKKWIEAGRILQLDPSAKVKCPECAIGLLTVKDEPIPGSVDRIDRYLICNNCGEWNVIRMVVPTGYRTDKSEDLIE